MSGEDKRCSGHFQLLFFYLQKIPCAANKKRLYINDYYSNILY